MVQEQRLQLKTFSLGYNMKVIIYFWGEKFDGRGAFFLVEEHE